MIHIVRFFIEVDIFNRHIIAYTACFAVPPKFSFKKKAQVSLKQEKCNKQQNSNKQTNKKKRLMEISYCRNDSLFSAARVAALNKGAAIKPYQPEHLG